MRSVRAHALADTGVQLSDLLINYIVVLVSVELALVFIVLHSHEVIDLLISKCIVSLIGPILSALETIVVTIFSGNATHV